MKKTLVTFFGLLIWLRAFGFILGGAGGVGGGNSPYADDAGHANNIDNAFGTNFTAEGSFSGYFNGTYISGGVPLVGLNFADEIYMLGGGQTNGYIDPANTLLELTNYTAQFNNAGAAVFAASSYIYSPLFVGGGYQGDGHSLTNLNLSAQVSTNDNAFSQGGLTSRAVSLARQYFYLTQVLPGYGDANGLAMYVGPTISNLTRVQMNFSDPLAGTNSLQAPGIAYCNGTFYMAYTTLAESNTGIATSPDGFNWNFYGYVNPCSTLGYTTHMHEWSQRLLVDATNGLNLCFILWTNAGVCTNVICQLNPNNPTNFWGSKFLKLSADTGVGADTLSPSWWFFPDRTPSYYLFTDDGNTYNATNLYGTWNLYGNLGLSSPGQVLFRSGTSFMWSAVDMSGYQTSSDLTNWGAFNSLNGMVNPVPIEGQACEKWLPLEPQNFLSGDAQLVTNLPPAAMQAKNSPVNGYALRYTNTAAGPMFYWAP